jgi:hypothetical protein
LKPYDRGTHKVVHICDLVLHNRAHGLCNQILASIQTFAAESGASMLTCWLPLDHPYRQAFEEMGFTRDCRNDRFVFATGPAELLPTLTTPSYWHLSQGDSDVY